MSELSLARFKTCTKCGVTYPADPAYFQPRKDGRYGVRADCRACLLMRHQAHRQKNLERLRGCRKEYYWANVEEGREKSRRWRLENWEAARERDRRYNEEHAEEIRAWRERYYRENAERLREQSREHYERNRQSYIEKAKRWEEENPAKARELKNASNRRRRALLRGNGYEKYTAEDINRLWHDQGGCCAYCGTPLFANYHIDHVVPISRGGPDKLDNLALACPWCNQSKNNKTVEEFLKRLNA